MLKDIEKNFSIPPSLLKQIIKDFQSEMARGLAGKKSSLKMIPTYVDSPTGNEKGKFIALDVGGSNFRILELELKGRGKSEVRAVRVFVLDKRYLSGTEKEFFGFLAGCVKKFLEGKSISGEESDIGFTFSFPMDQTGIASGRLLRWTKGFNVKRVIGKDVVKLLNEALARKGLYNIKIRALANDTVGTLVARSYEDPNCDIGIILGTGTNACYLEELAEIPKWKGPNTRSGRMIVNIEWGNFNKLPLTSYDKQLDDKSDRPGEQILEKMVSGLYLGKVTEGVIKSLGFNKLKDFRTEHMSVIEGDETSRLSEVNSMLKQLGVPSPTLNERKFIKKICAFASTRAARVSAACLASIIKKIDPKLSKRHTIAIDGTVYEKHPGFSKNMRKALKEIFKDKSSRISIALTKDGSGKGAAIIAAITESFL